MQDEERQRDDGGNAYYGFTRIYESVTARRTESVFYDGSGVYFGTCRGEKYPLRSRPHGRENAAYAPLFCADYARQQAISEVYFRQPEIVIRVADRLP
ncbi:hypothetical protein CNEO4_1280026 [Clostridium neonatale]|nr:hypothetical protein CNEO4_1280026 [Clostridium neonatale]